MTNKEAIEKIDKLLKLIRDQSIWLDEHRNGQSQFLRDLKAKLANEEKKETT